MHELGLIESNPVTSGWVADILPVEGAPEFKSRSNATAIRQNGVTLYGPAEEDSTSSRKDLLYVAISYRNTRRRSTPATAAQSRYVITLTMG